MSKITIIKEKKKIKGQHRKEKKKNGKQKKWNKQTSANPSWRKKELRKKTACMMMTFDVRGAQVPGRTSSACFILLMAHCGPVQATASPARWIEPSTSELSLEPPCLSNMMEWSLNLEWSLWSRIIFLGGALPNHPIIGPQAHEVCKLLAYCGKIKFKYNIRN